MTDLVTQWETHRKQCHRDDESERLGDLMAAEINQLCKLLEPFVSAYEKTAEAFGVPPERIYTTANCISTPYLTSDDFAEAYKVVKGK